MTIIIITESFICRRVILKVSEGFCKKQYNNKWFIIIRNHYIATRLYNSITCKYDSKGF
jgi:hypothetical protein